ncbi:Calcium and calcium/calmodulin-dependent serine/threonine-protein kinase [Capsicum chinense]|nr:Calcium and calcium/calmodulin-dependent serine/threonine-protein kinase [Capsicum chinense]
MGQKVLDRTTSLSSEYEVTDILGRGGFSVVRRGKSRTTHEVVAIKTLRRFGPPEKKEYKNNTNNNNSRALISESLLTNELLVMRKIVEDVSPHPNVIHLYDVCEDSYGVHLILELCSGGELFDRIVGQARYYNEAGAAAVVRQIAKGLEALHGANIVHRDLKPENCLFLNKDENSPLKIMDFGLSSFEDFANPVVGLFGSIDYVSPEALSREKITTKTDIWSLGVILYILLSGLGQFSFDEKTWKNISSSAKQLISSLLKVDPNMRPTAQEV